MAWRLNSGISFLTAADTSRLPFFVTYDAVSLPKDSVEANWTKEEKTTSTNGRITTKNQAVHAANTKERIEFPGVMFLFFCACASKERGSLKNGNYKQAAQEQEHASSPCSINFLSSSLLVFYFRNQLISVAAANPGELTPDCEFHSHAAPQRQRLAEIGRAAM